jgi:hypothetical protein
LAFWITALAASVWDAAATCVPAAPLYEIAQTPEPCYVAKETWFD